MDAVEARDPETGEPNILCVTQRERAGQRRGVPLLAPVLPTLKQMQIHRSRAGGGYRGIVHHAVYQA